MDDGTSEIYSAFLVEEEGTDSSFRGLLDVFVSKGLACSLYTDRGSHYFHKPEAGGKVDNGNLAQLGRALAQFGVGHNPAYSSEARGRSERMFATLQGRLVHELADAGMTTIAAANRFLAEASEPGSAFVPLSGVDLAEILCHQHERVVGGDNTMRYEGLVLQIPPSPSWRPHFVKATVRVRRYPDGGLAIFHGPRCIARYNANGILQENPVASAA